MFADITGSTRLYEVLNEAEARSRIADCVERMAEVVERRGGQVIKTIGDELLVTFSAAEAAGLTACDLQERAQDDPAFRAADGAVRLRLRIGMHHGLAILERGDVFGDAVNVAARMTALAKADQVIMTKETVDALPELLRASTRCIDRTTVKGKQKSLEIYELVWQHDEVTRVSGIGGAKVEPQLTALKLTYRDRVTTVNTEHGQVILGRSGAADITVHETLASRQHVRIELRRGKFFLVDQSTNGTYVQHNGEVAFVRRGELPLAGSGSISLGRSFKEHPREIVAFDVTG